MSMNIAPPQAPKGDALEQVNQLYRYLFRMAEQFNGAQEAMEKQILQTGSSQSGKADSKQVASDLAEQYSSLKSLIIKSADIVRSEMDAIITSLGSTYIAISEWGTYEESIQNSITATAKEIIEEYDYDAKISEVAEGVADFESYRISTSGYIRRGIIGYDDDGIPIIGIAIGQDLRSTSVETHDGETYDVLDMTRNMATYTSDRVTFWQNGVETAHFSNSELVVTTIRVDTAIVLGGWEVSEGNGLTIKWIGE